MKYDMTYARSCSCCGDWIDSKHKQFLKDNEEWDSEGNYCTSCYDEINMNNQLQLMDIMSKIQDSMKKPLNRFKFIYSPFEIRSNIIFKLMDKGVITWTIE